MQNQRRQQQQQQPSFQERLSFSDCEDHLQVLLKQETSDAYRTTGYLASMRPAALVQPMTSTELRSLSQSPRSATADVYGQRHYTVAKSVNDQHDNDDEPAGLHVHKLWRQKICEWAFQVVDHFDMNREVVSISMDYLDRLMVNDDESISKDDYQLLSLTCLYMAMKLFDYQHCLLLARPSSNQTCMHRMLQLSRGNFTVQDMEEMEMSVLTKLKWRIHPPTPQAFLCYLIPLYLPDRIIHPNNLEAIADLSKFIIELATLDTFFLPYSASELTMAALLNAADHLIPLGSKYIMAQANLVDSDIDLFSPALLACRERLTEVYQCTMGTDEIAQEAQQQQQHSYVAAPTPNSSSSSNTTVPKTTPIANHRQHTSINPDARSMSARYHHRC